MNAHFSDFKKAFDADELPIQQYHQLSIYDFLSGESQELPPSETVAQVDEAQESDLDAIPTEDTDLTLFSVGDTVKVINPYPYGHVDYDYLNDWEGTIGTIREFNKGIYSLDFKDIINFFYSNELIKINGKLGGENV